jgi:hypothetical protein
MAQLDLKTFRLNDRHFVHLDLETLTALQPIIQERIEQLRAEAASNILADLEQKAALAGLTVAEIVGTGRRRRRRSNGHETSVTQ